MNLLSDEQKILLKKGLRLRFFVVASFMLLSAIIISIVALVPSYVLARVRLAEIISSTELTPDFQSRDKEGTSLPKEITSKLSAMNSFIEEHGTTEVIYAIAQAVPAKVTIHGIYVTSTAVSSDQNREIKIFGIASDRKSLIDYTEELKGLSFVANVDVPVSSFAKERELNFNITVKITN